MGFSEAAMTTARILSDGGGILDIRADDSCAT
jgi:hypothetical protein